MQPLNKKELLLYFYIGILRLKIVETAYVWLVSLEITVGHIGALPGFLS
jgi:hypothetical protein